MTVFRYRRDGIVALALLVLPFVVLPHAFMPGKVMSPADNIFTVGPWNTMHSRIPSTNPLLGEITLMFHPATLYASEEVRAGRFPLWNPHTFGGAPFFANPQTALLFPLTALAYVLPHALALTMMSVLKLSIAGVGMFWFLRLLSIARWAAVVAAITFAFNALLVTWLQWSYGSALALLPLLFAATELVRARPGGRPMAALALTVALAILAGYPQRVVCWLVLLGVWAVYRGWTAPQPVRCLRRWTLAVTLGVALAALQLLPFAEYLRGSAVLAYRTEWMLYYPLPFRALAAIVMPVFFGTPTGNDYWGPMNFNELAVSVGVVPWLVLPVTGLVAWSRTGTKFFLVVLALSAAVVYGVPVLGPALASLPVLNTSIALRNADIFVFSLVVLAGIGLNALTDLPPRARRIAAMAVRGAFTFVILTSLAFVAGYYAMAATRSQSFPLWHQYLWLVVLSTVASVAIRRLADGSGALSLARLSLGAVQLAALLPLALTYNPVVDASLLDYRPPPVVKHLHDRTVADGGRVSFSGIGGANLGTIFRLFEFGGYDGMTPRYVEQLVDPIGSLDSYGYASGPLRFTLDATSPVLDLLGVRYIVVRPNAGSPAPEFTLDYRGPDAAVYANPRALPRAFVVFSARTCVDDATALTLIAHGQIDVRQEVLIAGCHDAPVPRSPTAASEATITASAADRVVVSTSTSAPGYLILTDAWFPGWRAWVDGAEHTVWRADHAVRAVWVPEGRHRIEFRYAPSSVRWGFVVTLFAGVAVLSLVWVPTWGPPKWLAGAIAALLIVGAPVVVNAKLDVAPLDLEATPTVVQEGERIVITLRPIDAPTASTTAQTYDLYVSLLAESGTRRGWAFLTPSGQLTPTAVPFRPAVAAAPTGPLSASVEGLPAGWYLVRALFVTPSRTQPARKHYTHQPRWVTIRVDPAPSDGSNAAVAMLAAATLAALVVVWAPRRRFGRAADESAGGGPRVQTEPRADR